MRDRVFRPAESVDVYPEVSGHPLSATSSGGVPGEAGPEGCASPCAVEGAEVSGGGIFKFCLCGELHPAGQPCPHKQRGRNKAYGRAYREARAQVLLESSVCSLCGKPATADDPFVADRIVPVSQGGSSDRSNLRAAHRSCNARRAAQRGNDGMGVRRISTDFRRADNPPPRCGKESSRTKPTGLA
jgi:hypothetical protein